MVLASRCLLPISSRCMWWTTWKSNLPLGRTGMHFRTHSETDWSSGLLGFIWFFFHVTWLIPKGSIYHYFWPLHRNMMIESARFSHNQGNMQMQDLSKLDVNSFDAVIFPGGNGVTKNLWARMKHEAITQRWNTDRHNDALILTFNTLDPLSWRMAKTANCIVMWKECLKISIVLASLLGMYHLVNIQCNSTRVSISLLKYLQILMDSSVMVSSGYSVS